MAMACYMIVSMIASVLISMALAPKPQQPEAATFSDFDIPQTDDGTPLTVFFGTCTTKSWTVLGLGNFRTRAVKAGSAKK